MPGDQPVGVFADLHSLLAAATASMASPAIRVQCPRKVRRDAIAARGRRAAKGSHAVGDRRALSSATGSRAAPQLSLTASHPVRRTLGLPHRPPQPFTGPPVSADLSRHQVRERARALPATRTPIAERRVGHGASACGVRSAVANAAQSEGQKFWSVFAQQTCKASKTVVS